MSDVNGNGPVPGWYPDPAGSAQLRWWDGTQWTGSLRPQPPVASQPPTVPQSPVVPPSVTQQPYPAQYPAGAADAAPIAQPYATPRPVQPDLGPHPKIYTPFIWIIALLPLVSTIAFAAFDLNKYVSMSVSDATTMASLGMVTDPLYLLLILLGWVVYGVTVWFAYLDWRALRRIGVVRPFHWAWAFLSGIVYVIGRSIVVRRRVGTGLIPIWVMIGVEVISFVVAIVKVVSLVNEVLLQLGSSGAFGSS